MAKSLKKTCHCSTCYQCSTEAETKRVMPRKGLKEALQATGSNYQHQLSNSKKIEKKKTGCCNSLRKANIVCNHINNIYAESSPLPFSHILMGRLTMGRKMFQNDGNTNEHLYSSYLFTETLTQTCILGSYVYM